MLHILVYIGSVEAYLHNCPLSIQRRLTGICFLANGDGGYHGAYGHSNMRPEYASERSIGKREQKLGWDFFESEIDIIPRV